MEDPHPQWYAASSAGSTTCGDPWIVSSLSCSSHSAHIQSFLPKLHRKDYFTVPSLLHLAARECTETGFCSRVHGFVIGCTDYGSIKFFGETDVRWLDLDSIVFFRHREVIVYSDEDCKPSVGYGLNKPAEVTLLKIQCRSKVTGMLICEGPELKSFEEQLRRKTEEQGAKFISYDALKQEWKFQVEHFSRFGLDDSDDDDEELVHDTTALVGTVVDAMQDIRGMDADAMEKSTGKLAMWQPERSDAGSEETEAEGSPMQDIRYVAPQSALAHSLPQHLRLDPLKMQQMKMLFFSSEEEADIPVLQKLNHRVPFRSGSKVRSPGAVDNIVGLSSPGWRKDQPSSGEDSPKSVIFSKHIMKISPQACWKHLSTHSPSPLGRHVSLELEQEVSPIKHSRMLMSLEGKSELSALKKPKLGFENKLNTASCMYGRSENIVDAALFLGCSFRVGWGPHGLLAHPGNPVGVEGVTLSSVVHVEKVALDGCVRDKDGKVRDDLIELQFISPLYLHMSLSRVVDGMDEHSSKIKLRFVQCSRGRLSSICDKYEDLLVKQYSVEGLSSSQHLVLRHQVMAWHLLSVLFSEKLRIQEHMAQDDEDLDTIDEVKVSSPVLEPEVAALVRRADFSSWLQDSVRLAIQEEVRDLDIKDHLKALFSLLTGRQLDDGVQLAASRGDVRLACLVSQAGGSMSMRRDIACQLETWEKEGLDFNLIERDMVLLYKLLSGDIEGALENRTIDWKRFLGLLMWYHLAPDTQLPEIINAYSFLVEQHAAPKPIPMYVEEGASNGLSSINGSGLYDVAYYLMLLHANQGQSVVDASKMFSSSSSTYDPLDHRMAWLQHGLLESIEVLAPTQLHVLDMNFVSQLLSVGECHWAIYVALHMPPNPDYPSLHEKVVKEILNQYCEVWSTNEIQQAFIDKKLGVPAEWLHEALGTYWQYNGDTHKAVKHLLQSMQWHRAHHFLMTSVAATLFLAGEYEELLAIVTPLERNKMELDDWPVSGGIYADFFELKNSFQSDDFTKELGNFQSKTAACKSFFQRLKESQVLWESRWAAKNRVVYSRMAHELATLLLAESKAKMFHDEAAELRLHNIVLDAPLPEDERLCRLQGAASAFTSWLLQTVPR
eukprot:c24994_g1_i1 orf=497-3847(+)